jgi:septin family protein
VTVLEIVVLIAVIIALCVVGLSMAETKRYTQFIRKKRLQQLDEWQKILEELKGKSNTDLKEYQDAMEAYRKKFADPKSSSKSDTESR